MRFSRKPEVMSPAGYWPQARAAVEAGADAIYFGLHHFSARAKVGFSLEELPELMEFLHSRGVRGYLTFNTLVFEHELEEASRAIGAAAAAGIDALIVQDVGVLGIAREVCPELELHASTQMSITSSEGVRFALSRGAHRVTLARELSVDEVASIYESTGAELEIFVHGALCVAYSGQCFSSEAWGGRSANRGQCAQACRLEYEMLVDGERRPLGDARYLLSPGDLCGLDQVPRIVEAGVASLKIEGRYKDADYVALTTHAYRQAVDSAWAGRQNDAAPEDALRLEQVYSRGLGPYFLQGVNHQAVVRGRAPRHRGVAMGTVDRVLADGVLIAPSTVHDISPLKAGDGIVFDAAGWRSPSEPEEGGRVYEARTELDGRILLRFGNKAIRLDRIRPGDLLWRTHDPDLDKAVRPFLDPAAPVARQPLAVRASGAPGGPLLLRWELIHRPELAWEEQSPWMLAAADKQSLSVEGLRAQLGRLGNTPYSLEEVHAEFAAAVFAPASALNQMRRSAVEALERMQRAPIRRTVARWSGQGRQFPPDTDDSGVSVHILVRTPEQLEAAIAARPASITLDYLDLFGLRPSVERVKAADIPARVASPRILKPGEGRIPRFLGSLECALLVRATGMIEELAASGRELTGDFSLNTANALTAAAYLELGFTRLTPTHDLNAAQIARLARNAGPLRVEAVAYQHLPVFHTEHCVFCRFLSTGTTHRDCGRPCEEHTVALRDRDGRAHPVIADVGCRNTVFGAEAQEASAHLAEWLAAGIRHFRVEFANETGEEATEVIEAFAEVFRGRTGYDALGRRLRRAVPGGTTEGSLFVPKDYLAFPILP